jgi:HK97 family phage prohead protease
MYIEGYAVVFNQRTILYEYDGLKFYEIIDRAALDGADLENVSFKYNHSDVVMILAGTRNGSLALTVDNKGLHIRAKLADTTAGRDLFELIKSRLINKMSFSFIVAEDSYDKDTRTRTVKRIKRLVDVSAVDLPAYPQTSLTVQTQDEIARNQKRDKLLDILKRDSLAGEVEQALKSGRA